MEDKNISKEKLVELYINQNLSCKETCEKLGLSKTSFYRKLKQFNIVKDCKDKSEVLKRINSRKIILDFNAVSNYYIDENHTVEETVKYFGVSESTIRRFLNKNNIYKSKDKRQENKEKATLRNNGFKNVFCAGEKRKGFQDKINEAAWSEEARQKRISTNIVEYGGSNPMNSTLVREKLENTNLDKYGVKYVLQSEEIRDKIKQTNLQRHNVENYATSLLTEKAREILKNKDKFIKYLAERKDNTTASISQDLECGASTVAIYLNQYDLWDYINYKNTLPEKWIFEILDKNGIKHQKTKKIISPLEIDAYCEDYNIGCEINGDYWHSSKKKDKKYHFEKSLMAQEKGIRLIHIWEYEWKDLRKRKIIESLLEIAFGKVQRRIYARNCEIREISNIEAKPFNEQNHLQGHRNAQVTYGLFYNNELVQLMSFSKTKYNKNLKKENSWEIIRGCPGSNNIVVGGVSKLFKHFIKEHNPDYIFSYCDFNKFDGKGYEAIGMKFIGYTGPDMKWLMPNGDVIERQPFRHKELKEKAIAQLWGAGSKKYLWTKQN